MLENKNDSDFDFASPNYVNNYIATQYLRSIQWFVINANRKVTFDFISKNNLAKLIPWLSAMLGFKPFWSLFKGYCYLLKILNSRKFMSLIGGIKKDRGVLFRLVSRR
jgi:hypothetical protein